MIAAWKTYWSIFWRTFTTLSVSILVGAQALDWSTDKVVVNATNTGYLLLGAAIGGVVAVGWAFVSSPATTALAKAERAAVQALLGSAIGAVTITNASDVLALGDLLAPAGAAIVLAFVVTYFQNQGGTPPAVEAIDPAVYQPFDKPADE